MSITTERVFEVLQSSSAQRDASWQVGARSPHEPARWFAHPACADLWRRSENDPGRGWFRQPPVPQPSTGKQQPIWAKSGSGAL